MIATEAIPFLHTQSTSTATDVQQHFSIPRVEAMAVVNRLRKANLIHTISRGGGATLSVYKMGPAPRPVTQWVPCRDMTVFLQSMSVSCAPANRA